MGGTAYRLYACDSKPAAKGKKKKVNYHWSNQVDIVARGMVLAGDTLFLAGAPDPEKGLKFDASALEDKMGGLVIACSVADGKKVAELKLESMPVFDGLAAANGRLYMTDRRGRVICIDGK